MQPWPSWFETALARFLTMRVYNFVYRHTGGPHPEERPLGRVSKDEVTELQKSLQMRQVMRERDNLFLA